MSEVEDTLYAEAILGQDAEEFFKTDIGRYVLARSKEMSDEAMAELKATRNIKEIFNLQVEIFKAEGTVKWLNEAIQAGKQALGQLENMQDES